MEIYKKSTANEDKKVIKEIGRKGYAKDRLNIESVVEFLLNAIPDSAWKRELFIIGFNTLYDLMKTNSHLVTTEAFNMVYNVKKILSTIDSFDVDEVIELELQRMRTWTTEVNNQFVNAWKKKFNEKNISSIIEAAKEFPLSFHSVVEELITGIAGKLEWGPGNGDLYNRIKQILNFIERIPSVKTTVHALDVFHRIVREKQAWLLPLSEGIVLAYTIKNVEAKDQITSAQIETLNAIKSHLSSRIQAIVWNPYVNIMIVDSSVTYYICATNDTFDSDNHQRIVRPLLSNSTDGCKWRIDDEDKGPYFRIRNYHYNNEEMYSSAKIVGDKRRVFTWIPSKDSGSEGRWKIIPAAQSNGSLFGIYIDYENRGHLGWENGSDFVFTWPEKRKGYYQWIIDL